jgi:hypothetical protein
VLGRFVRDSLSDGGPAFALMHWRLVVDRSPEAVSNFYAKKTEYVLEEQDVWFWLMDFIMLPTQALIVC